MMFLAIKFILKGTDLVNIKNIAISTQLKLGFTIVLLLVVVLGAVSYLQNAKLFEQTQTMYNHPLQVRRAIGKLSADIYAIHRDMKDLFLCADETAIGRDLNEMKMFECSAFEQIDILYSQYLGPRVHIDSVKQAFVVWNSEREETIRLFRTGQRQDAIIRTGNSGIAVDHVANLLAALQVIDDFAKNKADALFTNSGKLKKSLSLQLILLVATILLLSLFVNYIILHNINRPLTDIVDAVRRFWAGDLNARSSYLLKNEFGILSDSFNSMVASIQENKELDEKFAHLAGLMLSEYDTKKFFQATLSALATHTSSQMAAIYLLNNDQTLYEHFESTGVDNKVRQSFSATTLEGEFGAAISSRKVQHLKTIPVDTRFVFHSVCGTFIPREIITIPVLADNNVIAIISLASINCYSHRSLLLVDSILVTLCARVEGILAYHKTKELAQQLKHQNSELEAQKSEMAAQSAELTGQNRELEIQKQQLDEAGRLKTTFLSNMSHELRTPLNSVIALSGVLSRRLKGKLPAEEYSYLDVIERNGKMLLTLINDILDIARIESGHEEVEITRFDADALINDLVEMIGPQAQLKNINLNHRPANAPVFLESDSNKCRHILQNIIGNAVKFTEKGSVTIAATQRSDRLEIVVTDTGIGIAAEHLGHIFDEFRQADGSTSRRYGGTGLGLSIARKYASLLGGTVSVTSVPDTGSVFTLALPLRAAAGTSVQQVLNLPTQKARPVSLDAAVVLGKADATILLVDDSEPAIIQLKDILSQRGYRIVVARDGGEALKVIEQSIPDAIVLDLMMPGIDGFAVLKTVREAERTRGVPVLILTAKHITKDELAFLTRNNIHQLIQKGDVNSAELLGAVATMAHHHTVAPLKPKRQAQVIVGKPVVLIVEDNPDNMVTMRALLADEYVLIEAVDGHAGIEIAGLRKPHLILMDIGLPEKDGVEAFKTIRNNPHTAHIPVVAVTASAMTTDRETILAYGFDAYVAKPIDAERLYRCINEVLYGE